jgi:hypothetical protein
VVCVVCVCGVWCVCVCGGGREEGIACGKSERGLNRGAASPTTLPAYRCFGAGLGRGVMGPLFPQHLRTED